MIASQVNGLYSKASTPYAIQLYFTLAMALENKNVSYTYLVRTQILYAEYSRKSFGNRCYLCLLFFIREADTFRFINKKEMMCAMLQ